MKYTYYITDSTIFSKEEDMFKAMTEGATVVNDDANIEFNLAKKFCHVYLVAEERFTGKTFSYYLPIVRADLLAKQMDDVIKNRIRQ